MKSEDCLHNWDPQRTARSRRRCFSSNMQTLPRESLKLPLPRELERPKRCCPRPRPLRRRRLIWRWLDDECLIPPTWLIWDLFINIPRLFHLLIPCEVCCPKYPCWPNFLNPHNLLRLLRRRLRSTWCFLITTTTSSSIRWVWIGKSRDNNSLHRDPCRPCFIPTTCRCFTPWQLPLRIIILKRSSGCLILLLHQTCTTHPNKQICIYNDPCIYYIQVKEHNK